MSFWSHKELLAACRGQSVIWLKHCEWVIRIVHLGTRLMCLAATRSHFSCILIIVSSIHTRNCIQANFIAGNQCNALRAMRWKAARERELCHQIVNTVTCAQCMKINKVITALSGDTLLHCNLQRVFSVNFFLRKTCYLSFRAKSEMSCQYFLFN